MNCIYCDTEIKPIKYGKTKAGNQRYKCTVCNKTFVEEREIYTKTEKRLLSMFVDFLDIKTDDNYSLKERVKRSREKYHSGSAKLIIEEVCGSIKFDISKAKAVICQNDNKILIYKVKQDVLKDLETNRKAISLSQAAAMSLKIKEKRKQNRNKYKGMTPEEKAKAIEQNRTIQYLERKRKRKQKNERIPDRFSNIAEYNKILKPKDVFE